MRIATPVAARTTSSGNGATNGASAGCPRWTSTSALAASVHNVTYDASSDASVIRNRSRTSAGFVYSGAATVLLAGRPGGDRRGDGEVGVDHDDPGGQER